jgi:hypothetical protein
LHALERTIKLYNQTGSVSKKAYDKSSLPRKLTDNVKYYITQLILQHPGIYLREIKAELHEILIEWSLQFVVFYAHMDFQTSGSKKWNWSRNASLAIMKELYNEGTIQYSTMRDEIGEEAIDEMIKGRFLVYQPLPAVVNTGMEDSTRYPILNAPTPTHQTLRKYFKF